MNKLDKNYNKFQIGDVVRTNKLYQKNNHKEQKRNLAVKDFSFEYTKPGFNVKGDPIGYIYDLGSNVFLHESYLKQ